MCEQSETQNTAEERDEITGRTRHQQHCVDAYRERIRDAIEGKPPANIWDKAAARIRYIYQDAFGQGHLIGFAGITDEERAQWRVIAYQTVEWLAEALGDTVMDAKTENFQDDERVLLDMSPAPEKQEPKKPQVLLSRHFLKALEDAGILSHLDMTSSVTIIANAGDIVTIRQDMVGDDRLLDLAQTLGGAVRKQ